MIVDDIGEWSSWSRGVAPAIVLEYHGVFQRTTTISPSCYKVTAHLMDEEHEDSVGDVREDSKTYWCTRPELRFQIMDRIRNVVSPEDRNFRVTHLASFRDGIVSPMKHLGAGTFGTVWLTSARAEDENSIQVLEQMVAKMSTTKHIASMFPQVVHRTMYLLGGGQEVVGRTLVDRNNTHMMRQEVQFGALTNTLVRLNITPCFPIMFAAFEIQPSIPRPIDPVPPRARGLVTLLEFGGMSIWDWVDTPGLSSRSIFVVCLHALTNIAFVHEVAETTHNDINPGNILVVNNAEPSFFSYALGGNRSVTLCTVMPDGSNVALPIIIDMGMATSRHMGPNVRAANGTPLSIHEHDVTITMTPQLNETENQYISRAIEAVLTQTIHPLQIKHFPVWARDAVHLIATFYSVISALDIQTSCVRRWFDATISTIKAWILDRRFAQTRSPLLQLVQEVTSAEFMDRCSCRVLLNHISLPQHPVYPVVQCGMQEQATVENVQTTYEHFLGLLSWGQPDRIIREPEEGKVEGESSLAHASHHAPIVYSPTPQGTYSAGSEFSGMFDSPTGSD